MTLLALETRQKTAISNLYDTQPPTLFDVHTNDQLRKAFVSATPRPTKVCYTYNCHGLTFGSRRTQILSPADVRRILQEDNYVLIKSSEAMAGDVVIYVSSDGEIDHSGIVVEASLNLGINVPNPKILSKWGSGQEFIHHVRDCPYSFGYQIEYYRLEK